MQKECSILTEEQKAYIRKNFKPTSLEDESFSCRKCGSYDVYYRELDNDYGDIEYVCIHCSRKWYYEGADA